MIDKPVLTDEEFTSSTTSLYQNDVFPSNEIAKKYILSEDLVTKIYQNIPNTISSHLLNISSGISRAAVVEQTLFRITVSKSQTYSEDFILDNLHMFEIGVLLLRDDLSDELRAELTLRGT